MVADIVFYNFEVLLPTSITYTVTYTCRLDRCLCRFLYQ